MSTKVTIIGQEPTQERKLKPIEFVKHVSITKSELGVNDYETEPKDWLNIELVSKSNNKKYYDIMFAYDDDRSDGTIYLGYFNDGVIE